MRTEIHDGDAIVARAIAIASADERQAFIAQACGDNTALRKHVEEGVAAHFQGRSGADTPVAAANKSSVPSRRDWEQRDARPEADAEGQGKRIGPYTLLEQLAEGNTGFVFVADQQEPLPRRVALKLFKDGLDWAHVLTRLQAERQAAARLDHPNIAKVYDVGTTTIGRPYLVLELVPGNPILRYCDDQRLTVRQRLELFVQVCDAVQHAHQKGILHGNLNASHVLVAHSRSQTTPKILHFGTVEASRQPQSTSGPSAASSDLTGALEYLSPEQAATIPRDIDTRSDIYSLGVLLYELLTGSTPLTRQRVKQAAMPEALRLIREEEAPPPSVRLGEAKDTATVVAAKRHTDPATLARTVSGEVDALVLRALQKDRALRYQSAGEFSRDIQRYLAGEPVEAYPGSPAYRMWKWARKYPRGLLTAAVVLLLLATAGVVGILLTAKAAHVEKQSRTMVQQATAERDRAQSEVTDFQHRLEQAEAARRTASKDRDRELVAELAAKASARDTTEVFAFLKETMLSAGHPLGWLDGNWAGVHSKDVTLRQAVDAAEARIASRFEKRPLAEALVRETLGSAYHNLGDAAAAVQQYERALALREALQGNDNPETVACRNQLAIALRDDHRPEEASQLNAPNQESSPHAAALAISATVLLEQKKPAEAEKKLRQCLAIRRKLKPDNWLTFDAQSMLGQALLAQKKYTDAEPLLLSGYDGLKQRESKMPPHDRGCIVKALERLVQLYDDWGKMDKATQRRKELEELRRKMAPSGSRVPQTRLDVQRIHA